MSTLDIQALKERLTLEEGKRNKPYRDPVGKLTAGIGRNIDDVPFSDDEIDLMLTNDINRAIADLDRRLPWWRTLSPNRQSVLVDMCFNMGINKLLGFVNTLRKMQAGDYKGAAEGMQQSLWYAQVGNRGKALVDLMIKG